MRFLRTTGDVVWTFLSGMIAACLFFTFFLFVGLATVNFPIILIVGRLPHWLLICDAIVAAIFYVIGAMIGAVLAPIARVFSGR